MLVLHQLEHKLVLHVELPFHQGDVLARVKCFTLQSPEECRRAMLAVKFIMPRVNSKTNGSYMSLEWTEKCVE